MKKMGQPTGTASLTADIAGRLTAVNEGAVGGTFGSLAPDPRQGPSRVTAVVTGVTQHVIGEECFVRR